MDVSFALEVICTLVLQVTVLIAITFLLQRWVNDSRIACRLWTACFVFVIGLVAAGLLLPHRRLFDFPSGMSRDSLQIYVVWQSRISITLMTIWATGVSFLLVRKFAMCLRLSRFLKQHCETIDAMDVLRRVQICSVDWPQANKLRLAVSTHTQGPFCWQFHHPVIILPEFLLQGDDATLRHVLLHELEHLRTKHPMQHFLQGVCSTLFWFHPMVARAARRAELNREFLCDELAAKAVGKFGAYLRTLATVAERSHRNVCSDAPRGTLAFGNQESALMLRCKRLVHVAGQQTRPIRSRTWIAISGLFLTACLVQQVWLPTNAMASRRGDWSPWPAWTAKSLNHMGFKVRDFEPFEDRVQMRELIFDDDE